MSVGRSRLEAGVAMSMYGPGVALESGLDENERLCKELTRTMKSSR